MVLRKWFNGRRGLHPRILLISTFPEQSHLRERYNGLGLARFFWLFNV